MGWLNIVLVLYALFDIAMGVAGFVRKGSVPSLISGAIAGAIVLFSIIWAKSNPRAGRITALLVAVLMMGRFAPGTFQNELYPSGIIFVTSFAVAVCLGVGHMMGMRARKAREAAEK